MDLTPSAVRTSLPRRRAQLSELARRSKDALLFAAVLGACVGLLVAGFETVIVHALEVIDRAPPVVGATLPLVGLALAAAALRWIGGGATPATSDEYLCAFHDAHHRLGLRALAARTLAAVATLGSGCPMGLEGPSLYGGAALGDILQRRLPRLLSAENRRMLLVAGAAAGVAAIFKAPATGAIFAIEVPYQDDLARRMLLPALVASASGYLTFVAIHGTTPLFPVFGTAPFSTKDIVGAIALGLIAGIGARAFATLLLRAKEWQKRWHAAWRLPIAGCTLAAFFATSRLLTGRNVATGTGYATIRWALEPSRGLWLIAAILLLRCLGTATSVAGGGVGGLFVPLVVAGALTGRIVGGAVNALDSSLFTVIGVAAFLGAGYRVPLAAVMFVAEVTGRPGFVVPGVIAAVVAELLMGRVSVTTEQRRPDDETATIPPEQPPLTPPPVTATG